MDNIFLTDTIKIDFNKLNQLKTELNDNCYAEFIFHKLFSDPSAVWHEERRAQTTWQYPECWLARYYLYYVLHQKNLASAEILDLGSNLNFYSVWAILNGAKHVDAVEPDSIRFKLGQELVNLRGLSSKITCVQNSIDYFFNAYQGKKYDVVFLLDVFYYLNNGITILEFIQNQIKPKYLFLESTVVDDFRDSGHFELWYPSTDTTLIQSFKNDNDNATTRVALMPSRNVLNNILQNQGWKIISYYTYKDFIGHGESPPRKSGRKNFYVLLNPES